MGHRRRAREHALQMLFQIDLTGRPAVDVLEEFWQEAETDEAGRSFSERLVRGTCDERAALDGRIASAAEHWRIERMAVVDRNVLRLALYEMLHDSDTPLAVVIDEAIEIAKRFGSEGSGGFINGILDNIRKELEAERRPTP